MLPSGSANIANVTMPGMTVRSITIFASAAGDAASGAQVLHRDDELAVAAARS